MKGFPLCAHHTLDQINVSRSELFSAVISMPFDVTQQGFLTIKFAKQNINIDINFSTSAILRTVPMLKPMIKQYFTVLNNTSLRTHD